MTYNKLDVENMTDVYLISYMHALGQTKNPQIAVGAAMSVLNTYKTESMQKQQEPDPLSSLFSAMMMGAVGYGGKKPQRKDDKNEKSEDSKTGNDTR